MSKKEGKLTIIEKLIVISTFIAATVIIYTACWYVEISEVKEETHNAAEQLYLCNMNTDGDVYNSKFGRIKEDAKDYLNDYGCVEPIRIVINNSEGHIHQTYYYSTDLKAQTVYLNYNEDFENLDIDGNVITFHYKCEN